VATWCTHQLGLFPELKRIYRLYTLHYCVPCELVGVGCVVEKAAGLEEFPLQVIHRNSTWNTIPLLSCSYAYASSHPSVILQIYILLQQWEWLEHRTNTAYHFTLYNDMTDLYFWSSNENTIGKINSKHLTIVTHDQKAYRTEICTIMFAMNRGINYWISFFS